MKLMILMMSKLGIPCKMMTMLLVIKSIYSSNNNNNMFINPQNNPHNSTRYQYNQLITINININKEWLHPKLYQE